MNKFQLITKASVWKKESDISEDKWPQAWETCNTYN